VVTNGEEEKQGFMHRIFIRNGRLHPAWRAGLYFLASFLVMLSWQMAGVVVYLAMRALAGEHVMAAAEKLAATGRFPAGLGTFIAAGETVLLLLLTFIFCRFLDKRPLRSLGFSLEHGWEQEVALGLGLGLVLMAGIFVLELALGWLQIHGVIWATVSPLQGLLSLVLTFFSLTLAATNEEVVFRGYLLQTLQEWPGMKWAVGITSVAFAAVHCWNPHVTVLAQVNIALSGIVLCYAYLVTRRLWLPIAFHFSWNFFQGPVFSFPVSGLSFGGLWQTTMGGGPAWLTGGAFGPEGGLVSTVALGVAAVVMYRWAGRQKRDAILGSDAD